MKRAKYTLLLVLTILTIRVYGDVILILYSPAKVFVKIENLNEYPEIEIVGITNCLAFSKPEVYVFGSTPRVKVHKACPLVFYAVKKKYLLEKGIENIDWNKDKNVRRCNKPIDTEEFHSEYPNVEMREVAFNIVGFDEDSMVMNLTSSIDKFNNNSKPNIVKYFNSHEDLQSFLQQYRERFNLKKDF